MAKICINGETNQYLQVLNNISALASQSLSLDSVLYSSLDEILKILDKHIGGILLLDEDKQELRYVAYRGLSFEYVQNVRIRLGEGIAGKVAQKGEAIILEDVQGDPRVAFPNLILSEKLRGFASIPLKSKGKMLGVLNIACLESYKFSNKEIQLLNSIAAEVSIAIDNAKLHQEIILQDTRRRELLQEILSIQEEERKRIARELHDTTSQDIVSIVTSLEAAIAILPSNLTKAINRLRIIQSQLTSALDGVHRITYELRPALLDDLGLVAAVRWLTKNSAKKGGIQIQFRSTGKIRGSPEVETTLFRVIQEALSNIIKHAQCKHASVSLSFNNNAIEARIQDDGRGFDIKEAINSKERPRGLGLLGMKERIELIKGVLEIDSKSGSGTRIYIKI